MGNGKELLNRITGMLDFVNCGSVDLVGRLINKVTLFFATAAIAALEKLDVGPAMPAFFRLALTTVAVKSYLPNLPSGPLVYWISEFFPSGYSNKNFGHL